MWRDENEAVLTRLEDELLVERIWISDLGPVRDDEVGAPPRRAAGMIPLLCDRPGGREARGAALNGDLAAMRALLAPVRLAGYSAPLLHHLALHHARLGRALEGRAASRAQNEYVREIAAWVALAEERSYLLELARAVVGSALPASEVERIALSMPDDVIASLGEVARHGARELALGAAAALGALGRVDEACAIAGASTATSKRMAAKAERARSGAIEDALAPVRDAIAGASATGTLHASGAALFARYTEVWRWAHADEAVERAAVQEITPVLWEHYRRSEWDTLRALLRSVEPLVDRFARRIAGDPSRVAYAAPCAQILVFRAEAQSGEEVQLATLESALRLCATHRNGRLVLAGILCARAIRALERATSSTKDRAVAAAEADVARAEALYPQVKRLGEAKEKLATAKGSR